MWGLTVAAIYFGSFIAIGIIAKMVLGKLMTRTGVDLADVQALAGPNRRKRKVFLLGIWREEG
jgi:hypothetical protein